MISNINNDKVKFSVLSFFTTLILIFLVNAFLDIVQNNIIYTTILVLTGLIISVVIIHFIKNMYFSIKYKKEELKPLKFEKELAFFEITYFLVLLSVSITSIVIFIMSLIFKENIKIIASIFLVSFLQIVSWYWSLDTKIFSTKRKKEINIIKDDLN